MDGIRGGGGGIPLSLGPGLLRLVSLQLTFHQQECNHVANPSARKPGKYSPVGLPLARKEGGMDLDRQLTILAQKMGRGFSFVCAKRQRMFPCQ